MRRLRTHHARSGARFWLEAFARQTLLAPEPLPVSCCQYLSGYMHAYIEAKATVFDEAAMHQLLLQAHRLARRPIRHQRLVRWFWLAYFGLTATAALLVVQWLNDAP